MKNCANLRESIALLASGSLDGEVSIKTLRHVQECARCHCYFDELVKISNTHKKASQELPAVEAPARVLFKVMSLARHDTPKAFFVRQKLGLPLRVWPGGAFAFVMV